MSNFKSFATSKQAISLLLAAGASSSFYSLYQQNIKSKELKNSLYYKTTFNYIVSDDKFNTLAGSNYSIKKVELIEKTAEFIQFRIKFESIKGSSTVVAKLSKHSYNELCDINKKQAAFSLMSDAQKRNTLYVPYNFSEILIPSEECIDRVKADINRMDKNKLEFSSDLEKVISSINKNFHDYNSYEVVKSILNNFQTNQIIETVNKKNIPEYYYQTENKIDNQHNPYLLQPTDSLWRINSIILIANDTYVHNIIPKLGKKKLINYEDTFFNYKTIFDSLNEIQILQFNALLTLKEVFNLKATKTELIERKEQNISENISKRKKALFFNMFLGFSGFIVYAIVNKNFKIKNFRNLFVILNSNRAIINKIGNKNYISHYHVNKKLFGDSTAKFFIKGEKGMAVVNGVLEINQASQTIIISNVVVDIYKNNIDAQLNKDNKIIESIKINDAFVIEEYLFVPQTMTDFSKEIIEYGRHKFVLNFNPETNVYKSLI